MLILIVTVGSILISLILTIQTSLDCTKLGEVIKSTILLDPLAWAGD